MKLLKLAFLFFLLQSCSKKNPKGRFIEATFEKETVTSVTDSIWEFQTIRTYKYNDYNLTHKYYIGSDTMLTEYAFIEDDIVQFKMIGIGSDKSKVIGNNMYLLEKEPLGDSTSFHLLVARPATFADCTTVEVISLTDAGKNDTIVPSYTPKSDRLFFKLNNQDHYEIYVTSRICGVRSGIMKAYIN